MVLIESLKEQFVDCECPLESGSLLAYVAPQQYSATLAAAACGDDDGTALIPHFPRRKLSAANGGGGMEELDRWEGVLEMCQALDNAVEVDNEAELFADKRVMEFGFCTGLPSAFAFRHGAKSLCLYSWEPKKLRTVVKPTLRRNNVPASMCKLMGGDYENFKRTISQKFDVILAPELISTDESEFERLHELLEGALSPNGIILFSARPHYTLFDCSGNLPSWIDLVKSKGQFDAQIRWSSSKTDFAPRKLVQMNRTIR